MLTARPIVAIMFNRKTIKMLNENPGYEVCGYMLSAKEARISIYLFSVDDINTSNLCVHGWVPKANGQWIRERTPWPDIFYDQGKDMEPDERAKVDKLRKVLPTLVTPINAARFLDKWFLHRALVHKPALSPLIPDTAMCRHPIDLKRMLAKHQAIIVKPTDSSRGRGISLVSKMPRNRYQVESHLGHVHDNLTLRHAFSRVQRIAKRKKVLMQNQLHLLQIDERRFDLRMLMGKNAKGKWIVVSPRIRLGQQNSFITNTSRGAERLPLLPALQQAVGSEVALPLYTQVIQAAETVCQHIELAVGPMGEIGLDFIVDDKLRIWFIEANPQPGKAPLPHEQTLKPPLLYSHVMDYCNYLWELKSSGVAGFTPRTP